MVVTYIKCVSDVMVYYTTQTPAATQEKASVGSVRRGMSQDIGGFQIKGVTCRLAAIAMAYIAGQTVVDTWGE